jgi:hypothetical protein
MAQLQQRIARGIGLRGVGSGETPVFRDRLFDWEEPGHRHLRGGFGLPENEGSAGREWGEWAVA